jgi:hypothetical protein
MIGLSETRWIGFGEHVTGKGNTLIYSGKGEEEQHSEGIVRAFLTRAARSLMEWQPQSLRIIYARFRKNLSLIHCYARRDQAELEIKDEFFDQLKETLTKIKTTYYNYHG